MLAINMQKQLADIGGTDAQHVANDEAGVELSGLFVRSSPSFIDKVHTTCDGTAVVLVPGPLSLSPSLSLSRPPLS